MNKRSVMELRKAHAIWKARREKALNDLIREADIIRKRELKGLASYCKTEELHSLRALGLSGSRIG